MELKTVLLIVNEENKDYAIFIHKDVQSAWRALLDDVSGFDPDFSLSQLDDYKENSFAKHDGYHYRILDAVEVSS